LSKQTLANIYGFRAKRGLLGVEIECEGQRLPDRVTDKWTIHNDGSLRNGLEYVFAQPLTYDQAMEALDEFEATLQQYKTLPKMSYRTSVHVHMNVGDRTPLQVLNQIILYGIFEEILVDWCGPLRRGNLFCLRMKDANSLPSKVKKWARNVQDPQILNTDHLRYAALNMRSIFVHGSLEFRSMRGTTDKTLIRKWIDMLMCLYTAAEEFEQPNQIIEQASAIGLREFGSMTFGRDLWNELIRENPNWQDKMQNGIWLIQDAAYNYEPLEAIEKVGKAGKKANVILDDELVAGPGEGLRPVPVVDWQRPPRDAPRLREAMNMMLRENMDNHAWQVQDADRVRDDF